MAEEDGGRGLRRAASTAMWTLGSVGAIVGVALWTYDLGARDPGAVPAMTAGEGSWRRPPAEPGGRVIPGQDAQVYDRFGDAAASSGPVALGDGAERPDPADVEAAWARAAAVEAGDAVETTSDTVLAMVRDAAAAPETAQRARVIDLDLETPLAEVSVGPDAEPLAARPQLPPNVGAGSEPPPPNAAAAIATADPVAAAGADPAQSGASEDPAAAAAQAINAAAAALEAASPPPPPPRPRVAVDRVRIAERQEPDVYQVQLAALPTVAAVEARWNALRAQAPQLLGAYTLEVEPTTSNGARLYRLRIGAFEARTDAARLCGQLQSLDIECFAAKG